MRKGIKKMVSHSSLTHCKLLNVDYNKRFLISSSSSIAAHQHTNKKMNDIDFDSEVFVNHHNQKNAVSVRYDTESHLSVIFRLHASVWMNALSMCIINSCLALIVHFYDLDSPFPLSYMDTGHVFMSLMVSYLIISRLSNSLNRYMDGRKQLGHIMQNSRELIQQAIAFTRYGEHKIYHQKSMKWRVDVSKRLVSLLRAIVTNLQHASTGKNVWQEKELTDLERRAMLYAVGKSNERTPYILTMFLRSVIVSHEQKLCKALEVPQEAHLLTFTSHIINAYTHIMKDINTPYPFPLVQMTRTFLFIWVFTLPFVLSNDIDNVYDLVFVIFFLTYGFLGIELISIEMDDPYGDDPNDFDVVSLVQVVYKDIEVSLFDIDGIDGVNRFKRILQEPSLQSSNNSSQSFHDSNQKSDSLRESYGSDKIMMKKTEGKTTTFMKRPHGKLPPSGLTPRKQSLDRRQHFQSQSSPGRRRKFQLSYDNANLKRASMQRGASSSMDALDLNGNLIDGAIDMDSTRSFQALSSSSYNDDIESERLIFSATSNELRNSVASSAPLGNNDNNVSKAKSHRKQSSNILDKSNLLKSITGLIGRSLSFDSNDSPQDHSICNPLDIDVTPTSNYTQESNIRSNLQNVKVGNEPNINDNVDDDDGNYDDDDGLSYGSSVSSSLDGEIVETTSLSGNNDSLLFTYEAGEQDHLPDDDDDFFTK